MGFGLLIIGYILVFCGAFAPQISMFSYILGSGVVLFSLRKLILENKLFIASAITCFVLELVSIISVAIQLFSGNDVLSSVMVYLTESCAVTLNVLLMISIFILAREVSLPKLAGMAISNLLPILISVPLYIASQTVKAEVPLNVLTIVYYIVKLIYTVFSVVIIFNSYMRICYEGDEKMQQAKTGIALFDRLNELSDKAFSKKPRGGKK